MDFEQENVKFNFKNVRTDGTGQLNGSSHINVYLEMLRF